MKASWIVSISLATCALPAGASAQEGGIEVFAAETLFSQGTRVSLTHIFKRKADLYMGSERIDDPLDQSFEEQRIVLGIDHGLRPDLTASVLVPFVRRSFESAGVGASSSGFGDVAVLGKLRAYKRDWLRGAMHVSLIGGLELPTADTDQRDNGALLPPSLQPGSGSLDPFVAVAANLNLNRLRFDALAFFKFNQEGSQDFEQGDFLAAEVGGAYRFLHTKYPGPSASARVGLQWRHEGSAEQAGSGVPNTGSDELLLRTGLGWHPTPGTDVSLAVDFPLDQDLEGEQLGLGTRTFFAIGFRF